MGSRVHDGDGGAGACWSGGGRDRSGGAVRGHHHVRLGHLRLRESGSAIRRVHKRERQHQHWGALPERKSADELDVVATQLSP